VHHVKSVTFPSTFTQLKTVFFSCSFMLISACFSHPSYFQQRKKSGIFKLFSVDYMTEKAYNSHDQICAIFSYFQHLFNCTAFTIYQLFSAHTHTIYIYCTFQLFSAFAVNKYVCSYDIFCDICCFCWQFTNSTLQEYSRYSGFLLL